MKAIFAIAIKDLRLLRRNHSTMFFTFVWPILMAGFGLMFGGEGERAKMRVLVNDNDQSEASQAFVAGLLALDSVTVERAERNAAAEQVKHGRAVALIDIPSGFGVASERLFYGVPATVDVLIDPSRKAEIGMLEGLLMQVASHDMSRKMTQVNKDSRWLQSARRDTEGMVDGERQRFDALFDALENLQPETLTSDGSADTAMAAWQPLKVQSQSLQSDRRGPRNPFAISFPQGMLWGLIGALMGFASGFAQEREKGTWLRLRTGPLGTGRLMAGKALAAMIALVVVQMLLLLLAWLVFGLTVESLPALVLVVAASAVAFTGLMLLIASAGRTVQGVSSAGWAALMPLMMVGGGMIPLIAMPAWMATISAFSPVNWSLRSLEGAIWRGYAWPDYLWPVSGLMLLGIVAFLLGARRLSRMID